MNNQKSKIKNTILFAFIIILLLLSQAKVLANTFLYGDVNAGGKISADDAALTAQAAVGLITLTPGQTKAADVSGDGAITAYDAALIAQRAAGLIKNFPVEAHVSVTVLSSLEKVLQDEVNVSGAEAAEIFCAKNEYESFQILIANPTDTPIPQINFNTYNWHFSGTPGEGLPELTLYREHYVKTTAPSYGLPTGTPVGWYPDALIPFVDPYTGNPITTGIYLARNQNVQPHKSQGYWVDVHVGSNVKAGVYTNEIEVLSNGQVIKQIPITLTVWNFELPKQRKFITWMYGFYSIAEYYESPTGQALNTLYDRYRDMVYENGIYPEYQIPSGGGIHYTTRAEAAQGGPLAGTITFQSYFYDNMAMFISKYGAGIQEIPPSWILDSAWTIPSATSTPNIDELKRTLQSYNDLSIAHPEYGQYVVYLDEPWLQYRKDAVKAVKDIMNEIPDLRLKMMLTGSQYAFDIVDSEGNQCADLWVAYGQSIIDDHQTRSVSSPTAGKVNYGNQGSSSYVNAGSSWYDSVYWQISDEGNGIVAELTFKVGFKKLQGINFIYGRFTGVTGGSCSLEAWDYVRKEWVNIGTMAHSTSDKEYYITLSDETYQKDYDVGGGEVKIRFVSSQKNSGDVLYLDLVRLAVYTSSLEDLASVFLTDPDKILWTSTPYGYTDANLSAYRDFAWYGYQLEMTGGFNWRATMPSTMGIDAWTQSRTYTNWDAPDRVYNGAYFLIYHGDSSRVGISGIGGPIPSMRLKTWRKACEDFEYFKMLEELTNKATVDAIVANVVHNYYTCANPQAYAAARKTIAEMILNHMGKITEQR